MMHLSNYPPCKRLSVPGIQNLEMVPEDGEIVANNDRIFTGNGSDTFTRRREHQPVGITANESQNIHFNPSSITRQFNRENEQSSKHRSVSGNYLHLSYYGEEVDKEYLPEVGEHFVTRNKEHSQEQQEFKPPVALHWNLNGGVGQQNHHQWNRSFRTTTHHHLEHQQQFQQRQLLSNDWRRYENVNSTDQRTPATGLFSHMGADVNYSAHTADVDIYDYRNMVVNVPPPEVVSNFKTAASSFQERQAKKHNNAEAKTPGVVNSRGLNTFQEGWSGATEHVTVKRKVALCNDEDHETRLHKRLSRFREPVERTVSSRSRRTDKVSLEDIIKSKKIKHAQQPVDKQRSRSRCSSKRRPTSSTWKSGDGKSFSAGFVNGYNNVNDYGQYDMDDSYFKQHETQRYNESRGRQRYQEYPDARSTFKRNSVQNWNAGGGYGATSRFTAVVIDGSNVAFTYGDDLHFACEGIRICVNFFVQMGCKDITVIVPKDRLKRGASKDVAILQDLKQRNMLLANWGGQFASDGNDADDRLFILDVALNKEAIIVSNLNFTDVARYNPGLRQSVWNRVFNFRFTTATPKEIQFPDIDESGMYGPTWKNVLNI